MSRSSHEAAFLAESLRLFVADRPRMAELASKNLRWRRIERIARANAVLGAVYRSIADQHLEAQVETTVLDRMQEHYVRTATQNTLFLHETTEALAALRSRGIDLIVLKGAALLIAHFPCLGSRHLDDIDAFIPAEQARDAMATLERLGYRRKLGCDGAPLPLGDLGRPSRSLFHHLPAVFSPRGAPIELHVTSPAGSYSETWDAIRARCRSCDWSGTQITIPAAEDLVWMACYHALGKHHSDARFLPRLLLDLHVLAETSNVRPHHVIAPANVSDAKLSSAGRWLDAFEGAGGQAQIESLFFSVAKAGDFAARAGRLRHLLSMKPHVLARLIFPTREYMTSKYGKPPTVLTYAKRLAVGLLPPALRVS